MNGRDIGAVAGFIALGVMAGGMMWSQASAQDARGAVATQKRVETEPSHRCRNVLAEIRVMQSEMLDLDRRLNAKAEGLNATDPKDRLDATQAVLVEMIAQRRELRLKMKVTHQRIVSHVLQHLMIEDPAARREAMLGCPLMKRMKAGDDSFGDLELWY
ncbi:MAG: hypothetical protein GY715_14915 [Planctomycetes bacterium]|nr:hypothetical protein [Planctomycetota bacterium]